MQTVTPDKVAVAFNPVPGFCVKSRSTNNAVVHLTGQPDDLHVIKGLKVFVNIAWDENIPPPPPATDDAVQRAMQGLDIDEYSPEAWFVPIVLSDARQDSDKGQCHTRSVDIVLRGASVSDAMLVIRLIISLILSHSGPAIHRLRLCAQPVHQISLPQRFGLQKLPHRY